jgi:hypothetical protein
LQRQSAVEPPLAALNFLEKFYLTPEFQAYSSEVDGAVSLVRSYIANTVYEANPD